MQRKIVPRTTSEKVPLSYSQWRLWYLDQFQAGMPTYNLSVVNRLKGPLEAETLNRSLNEIIKRHESLRTIFPVMDSEPVQVIQTSLEISLQISDLRALGQEDKEQEARKSIQRVIDEPFNLNTGPLIRARLYRLQKGDHILLVGMHHIISDAWSMRLFYQELDAIYTAFTKGEASPLPEISIQYPDYSIWQQQWLQGDRYKAQLSYWKDILSDAPMLEIPTDFPRPRIRTHHGARHSVTLSNELTNAIKNLGKDLQATSFMVMLSAFSILLYRLSGQMDIVIGMPFAGRNRLETEKLIGFFLNSLVLRVQLSKSSGFSDLVREVRLVALNAFDHKDIPFEKIIEELNPPRDLNRTPFFQIFFNMFDVKSKAPKLGNLKMEPFTIRSSHSLFDLTVYVRNDRGRYRVSFAYNTNLFSEKRISAMVTQYQHLLKQIIADPGREISKYTLVVPGLEKVFPDPTVPLSAEWHGTIHEKITQHAHKSPNHTAIVDKSGEWTYRELDQYSGLIAQQLVRNGVSPGDVVAIYAHRSAALLAAILGIHKAGGVFIILDPVHPPARLLDYIQLTEPVGLLRLEAAGRLPDQLQAELNRVHAFLHHLPSWRPVDLPSEGNKPDPSLSKIQIGPDDPACVVFTSGSSGKPKGILGRHGSLSHFLPWQLTEFNLGPSDRFSMLSGLSHDPLQRDIFTCLWAGATLCIPDPDRFGNPGWLADWIMQQDITFAHVTPPMAQYITTSVNRSTSLDSVKVFFFVGDQLSQNVVASLRTLAPLAECINSYGSTETQRAVGYYRIPPGDPVNLEKYPLMYPVGRGIPDVQLLVLNDSKSLCAVGELGEIHIRSPHLALGYIHDGDQTATRFITNPFTDDLKDRLYGTGDYGRYRPDGNVEFAGRIDKQVKIRGFRIELREIETALIKHPYIKDVVTLLGEKDDGSSNLVTYFISSGQIVPTARELRQFLQASLPNYMIPSSFVPLDRFPLTPNGKINESLLPFPDPALMYSDEMYVTPSTPEEKTIAVIWSEILGVNTVGVYADFYELGGNSLLAIRIVAAVENALGTIVPLSALIQNPTVAGLASAIAGPSVESDLSHLVALRREGSRHPLFCIPPAASTAMRFEKFTHHLGKNQPIYAFEYHGMDGKSEPLTSIPEMAQRYIQDIQKIQTQGPYYLAGMCFGGIVAFEMAQQLLKSGEPVAFLGVLDSNYVPLRRKPPAYYQLTFKKFIYEQILGRQIPIEDLLPRIHRRRDQEEDHLTQRIYRVFTANLYARLKYTSPPYPGLITKFSTDWRVAKQATVRWHKATTLGLEDHIVPGSHVRRTPGDTRMLDEPNVQVVAEKLRECLERATLR